MIRIFLGLILLAALPFFVYFLYETSRHGKDGRKPRRPAEWERPILVRLALAGAALAAIGLIILIEFGAEKHRGRVYEPAKYEDGVLTKGRFVPADRGD